MTNEEAIDELQWGYPKEDASVEECLRYKQAIDMAIFALKESRPKREWIRIDDVMSVFDDFMCGEVDEDGTATFLEMLEDKAESEV